MICHMKSYMYVTYFCAKTDQKLPIKRSDDFDIVITSSLMTSSGNLQIGPKIQILEQVIKYFHKIGNAIPGAPIVLSEILIS